MRGVEALQLGEDLLVQVQMPPGQRAAYELRSRQMRDELRDLYVYSVELVPADGGVACRATRTRGPGPDRSGRRRGLRPRVRRGAARAAGCGSAGAGAGAARKLHRSVPARRDEAPRRGLSGRANRDARRHELHREPDRARRRDESGRRRPRATSRCCAPSCASSRVPADRLDTLRGLVAPESEGPAFSEALAARRASGEPRCRRWLGRRVSLSPLGPGGVLRAVEATWRRGPRERLRERGTESLDDVELLALLLRTGARGRPAETLARELLGATGLHGLARAVPAELERQPGVGPAKAATLLAALELGRRLAQRTAPAGRRHPRPGGRVPPLPRAPARRAARALHLLLLDGRHRLLREVMASQGTLTASLVHPREVFRPALREGAAALVLVHNHPSGDPAPSREDREVTRRLVQAGALLGVPVLDHVVVAERGLRQPARARRPGGSAVGEGPAPGRARRMTHSGCAGISRSRPTAGQTKREAMADRSRAETRAAVERRRAAAGAGRQSASSTPPSTRCSRISRATSTRAASSSRRIGPARLDEKVELKFRLPGSSELVHARGRVVRAEPATRRARAAGMAIEFEELDGDAREVINAAVRRLRSEPR